MAIVMVIVKMILMSSIDLTGERELGFPSGVGLFGKGREGERELSCRGK